MHCEYVQIKASDELVGFGCDSTHVYMIVVDGITFGPFKCAEGAGIPSHATPANVPPSVFCWL